MIVCPFCGWHYDETKFQAACPNCKRSHEEIFKANNSFNSKENNQAMGCLFFISILLIIGFFALLFFWD